MNTISELIAAFTKPEETELARRLRVMSEALEHLRFCEQDYYERRDAAVTPFATAYWKDND